MSRRVAIRGVVIDEDGKIFGVKLTGYKNGKPNEFYCTPGGGLDEDESITEGLQREMVEETGVEPEVGNLLYIQQFKDDVGEQLELFFHIKNTEDYKNIDLSKTSHGVLEIAEFDFVDPSTAYFLPKFFSDTDVLADIAAGGPAKIFSNL